MTKLKEYAMQKKLLDCDCHIFNVHIVGESFINVLLQHACQKRNEMISLHNIK